MVHDSFLQIDGVKGESTDSAHKDWIEILSYAHAITQPASATAGSAGGGTIGRCKHDDFVITKYVDLASPKLYELCCSGKHISKVVIELMRASGDAPVKYMAIEMDQVVISKVNPVSAARNNGSDGKASEDLPTESIAFNYGVIKWTYTQQKRADGSKGGNVTGGWSLVEGKTAA
jgi:type VI secretion system secreted protein Hcp